MDFVVSDRCALLPVRISHEHPRVKLCLYSCSHIYLILLVCILPLQVHSLVFTLLSLSSICVCRITFHIENEMRWPCKCACPPTGRSTRCFVSRWARWFPPVLRVAPYCLAWFHLFLAVTTALCLLALFQIMTPSHAPDHLRRVPRLGGFSANSFHVHVQPRFAVSISIVLYSYKPLFRAK